MTDDVELGPVDYLIVEYPGNKMTGRGLEELIKLVDRGTIRVLDLVFVGKDEAGNVAAFEIADFDGDGQLDLAVFEGASSGLLDESDLANAGDVIEPGNSAAILVYENTWAAPLAAALRGAGAELVASGRIPVADLVSALDTAEAVG
jgi:hypothetical protein